MLYQMTSGALVLCGLPLPVAMRHFSQAASRTRHVEDRSWALGHRADLLFSY
jgi:hypothetical protein